MSAANQAMPPGLQTKKRETPDKKCEQCTILRCNFEHSVPETTGCVKGNGQGAGSRGWKPRETMVHIDRRLLQGQLASLETMEVHGRPWENTACQGPPGTARASGKAGDHRRETTGDQNVPKSTGRGKNIWQGGRSRTGTYWRPWCAKDRKARPGQLARWVSRGHHGKPREKTEQHGRPRCVRDWWPRQGRPARCKTKRASKRRP